MDNNLTVKTETYRILGVDPGTNILGFGILEVEGKNLKMIDLGVLHLKSEEEQPVKLQRIFERLQEIIAQYQPREMAIETPFYGKNVQSMFKLGRAQGVAIAAAITKGLTVNEYAAKKIKQAVAGNGNASKEQVASMLAKTLKIDLNENISTPRMHWRPPFAIFINPPTASPAVVKRMTGVLSSKAIPSG